MAFLRARNGPSYIIRRATCGTTYEFIYWALAALLLRLDVSGFPETLSEALGGS
jgi:hypothetical protein